MRVVSLAQQKGGCGKSLLAANLAIQAAATGALVAIVDVDPQHTTLKWGQRRTADLFAHPTVVAATGMSLQAEIAKLGQSGMSWVFLDLPGRDTSLTGLGMKASDFVLIPCRPLDVEIEASVPTVKAARGLGVPYAYVINAAPAQPASKRAVEAMEMLRKAGHSVAPIVITSRLQVPDAHTDGRGVSEIEPLGSSAAQFKALFGWLEQQRMECAA